MRPASPHISAGDTAARPRRGILGTAKGNDDDLLNEEVLELTRRSLVEGEGLDLGVTKFLGVFEEDLDAISRPRTPSFFSREFFLSGEPSEKDKLASDLTSELLSMC